MATRSDQLHSHQFALQRVVAAVALRDPDAPTSSLRRAGAALLAGTMVAALGLAAFGIYGLLRPGGGDAWRDGASVIIEKESGARFVYREGLLHPVLNYSSALLILGTPNPPSAHVARAGLVGVPRGVPLGIPGAPDLLPAPADLLPAPWTICSRRPVPPVAAAAAESVLLIGAPPPASEPLRDRGLLARDATGGLHLIWNARRHPVTAEDLLQPAFGWSPQAAVPVATAVLNAVPAGAELGRVLVERASKPSAVEGYRVGEVFVVQTASGARTFGVARPDGLSDITQVQADLLLADGANGPGGRATDMGQARYASAPRSASLVPSGTGAPPETTPDLARVDERSGLCAAYDDGATAPELTLATNPPRPPGEVRPGSAPGDLTGPVDWVAVPPGRGALVESLAGPGAAGGALAVVSDLGQRFPLANRETLAPLGYADVRPIRMPAAVVALLPAGSALDATAALTPA